MNKPSKFSWNWVYWVALVLALAVVGVGVYTAVVCRAWSVLAAGCASIVAVLVTWPLALQLQQYARWSLEQTREAMTSISERFEQFSVMLNVISEQQLISDRAKSVVYREKDREALRLAIQEDINKSDWEAAHSLIREMEHTFGYKQEADRLREQIEQRLGESVRKQVADAVAVIERHVRAESWGDALREAQRVAGQFPDHPQARNLPAEIEGRRDAHKKQLIESWHEAVARKDVDGSIEILKHLDNYLTPTEAEAFQETARGIFKEKLSSLRAQFSAAVQDRNWTEAVCIGEAIMTDFPNTTMAQEVRDALETLRARAAGAEIAVV